MIEPSRRALLTGLISLIAAPAIVRAGSLMPVKQMTPTFLLSTEGWTPIPHGQIIGLRFVLWIPHKKQWDTRHAIAEQVDGGLVIRNLDEALKPLSDTMDAVADLC